jgi:hypothetical protein
MKIGVISDTHGSVKCFEKAIDLLGKVDKYIHLGDYLYHGPRNPLPEDYDPKKLAEIMKKYNISYISGNCDSPVDNYVLEIPEFKYYSVESYGDFSFFYTHGYSPSLKDAIEMAVDKECHFLFHGHTHVSGVHEKEDIVIVNPGSTSLPKENTPKSCCLIELVKNKVIIKLINLDNGEFYFSKEYYEK